MARPRVEGLTGKQKEVVSMIGQGLSTKQMAQKLLVSENTIRAHVRDALRKTGTQNRIALIAAVRDPSRNGHTGEINALKNELSIKDAEITVLRGRMAEMAGQLEGLVARAKQLAAEGV